jgi:hypothetical protein
MTRPFAVGVSSCALALAATGLARAQSPVVAVPAVQGPEAVADWYNAGNAFIDRSKALKDDNRRARNVVLFVGDGMGISTITAARILEGQLKGKPGEENRLSFDNFPYTALSKTYSWDQQTSDSAPTMTAMATGYKTREGMLSVNHTAARGECDASVIESKKVKSILELAAENGKATGIVTTARLTHATPAALYAHTAVRDWEADSNLSVNDINTGAPCRGAPGAVKDIARQLIELSPTVRGSLKVALGGGRTYFLPAKQGGADFFDPEYPTQKGRRLDGRNLAEEWVATRGGALQDRPGKPAPGRVAAVHSMIGAGRRRLVSCKSQRNAGQRSGEVPRRGRAAALVVNDLQPVALSRQPQHRLDEVAPVRAHHPGGAQDGVTPVGGPNGLLAAFLAGAVDAKGSNRIILAVGPVRRAVEHIVGRDMDQRDVAPRRLGRKDCRCQCVQPPGRRHIRFGLVHGCIGGRVDHRGVGLCVQHRRHCCLVGDVAFGPGRCVDRYTSRPGMPHQLGSDLASATQHARGKRRRYFRTAASEQQCVLAATLVLCIVGQHRVRFFGEPGDHHRQPVEHAAAADARGFARDIGKGQGLDESGGIGRGGDWKRLGHETPLGKPVEDELRCKGRRSSPLLPGSGAGSLLRLGTRCLHHLRPSLDLAADEGAERFGRAAHRRCPECLQPLFHVV